MISNFVKGAFALLFTALIFVMAPAQQLVDGIAALVGEKIILVSDVNQMAMEMARQNGVDFRYQQSQFQAYQEQALNELINVEIILLQADVDSITVKDRDVENAVNNQVDQYLQMAGGSEEALESAMGISVKTLREKLTPRIKSSLLVQQMQAKKFENISVTRPEVIAFYEAHKDSIPPIPARVEIAHILMSPRASDSKSAAVKKQLQDIRQQIVDGKIRFEDAAKKYSQDPGSAERGGDLGFVPRGTFVPEFEKAAWSLEENQLSDIIKTQFGYHLIQLLEKRGEQIHARHILLTLQTDDTDVQETINKLSTLRQTIINTGDFESAAREYSEDPDAVTNGGYLGEFPLNSMQIQEFSNVCDTLKPGEISMPFKTQYGIHILKLISYKPSENIDLYKHYNIVENMVLNEKRQNYWNKWLLGLRNDFYVERKM